MLAWAPTVASEMLLEAAQINCASPTKPLDAIDRSLLKVTRALGPDVVIGDGMTFPE